jgi:hypothetical protein
VDAYQTKCNDFRYFTKLGKVSGKRYLFGTPNYQAKFEFLPPFTRSFYHQKINDYRAFTSDYQIGLPERKISLPPFTTFYQGGKNFPGKNSLL